MAARHLVMFLVAVEDAVVTVVYPKRSYDRQPHYANLVQQCLDLNISVLDAMPDDWDAYDCLVDAIFGFSFTGTPRPPFDAMIQQLHVASTNPKQLVVAVDVPSGWNVNGDDDNTNDYMPDVLVSLTAPKLCAQQFRGQRHFVGGRFLPPGLAEKYRIRMPAYPGVSQVVEVPVIVAAETTTTTTATSK